MLLAAASHNLQQDDNRALAGRFCPAGALLLFFSCSRRKFLYLLSVYA
ncbi:hypothetical protein GCWU000342_00815 [Shuttleworthella satelles DSM 14600]|uniref:Uncharacterized protein n=1 Tax=Shuttleworthella satelles DSM 14600 TaxID=626523 RepID=C4GA10_9FIRM|nr:hypothetical protein GCWU000342_00815 [Shuttleworthia satelles DSM 14600]